MATRPVARAAAGLPATGVHPLTAALSPARHKSGYGSYGPPAGWQRGVRVIVLREGEDPALSETYIRLEDGTRVDQAPSSTPASTWVHQFFCL